MRQTQYGGWRGCFPSLFGLKNPSNISQLLVVQRCELRFVPLTLQKQELHWTLILKPNNIWLRLRYSLVKSSVLEVRVLLYKTCLYSLLCLEWSNGELQSEELQVRRVPGEKDECLLSPPGKGAIKVGTSVSISFFLLWCWQFLKLVQVLPSFFYQDCISWKVEKIRYLPEWYNKKIFFFIDKMIGQLWVSNPAIKCGKASLPAKTRMEIILYLNLANIL